MSKRISVLLTLFVSVIALVIIYGCSSIVNNTMDNGAVGAIATSEIATSENTTTATQESTESTSAAEDKTELTEESSSEEPSTEKLTEKPTEKVTEKPTQAPTEKPTEKPTQAPTEKATQKPTQAPTEKATEKPTQKSTEAPTQKVTQAPTQAPTQATVVNAAEAERRKIAEKIYNENIKTYEEVLKLTNEYRAKNGKAPLVLDKELCLIASYKAYEIGTYGFKSDHSRPDGRSWESIYTDFSFKAPGNWKGENIARGHETAKQVVDDWYASVNGHRLVMLAEQFNRLGVGYYKGGWAQEFSK